jgi:hypothetical protein
VDPPAAADEDLLPPELVVAVGSSATKSVTPLAPAEPTTVEIVLDPPLALALAPPLDFDPPLALEVPPLPALAELDALDDSCPLAPPWEPLLPAAGELELMWACFSSEQEAASSNANTSFGKARERVCMSDLQAPGRCKGHALGQPARN